jgi:hypothetical protein
MRSSRAKSIERWWRDHRRQERYRAGKARGWLYRVRGGHPAVDVSDRVLADRIRSTLGPLEKRLGVPPVHVTVEDHVVSLHGAVGGRDRIIAIERAVRDMEGVAAVHSHLRVVLTDT